MSRIKRSEALSELLRRSKYGGLTVQLMKTKMLGGLRKANDRRQSRRYEDAGRLIHVGNLIGGVEWCEREQFYRFTEKTDSFSSLSDRKLLTFYEGDQTENQFDGLLRHGGIDTWKPRQVKARHFMIGTPDRGIVWRGEQWLAEIKSLAGIKWRGLIEPTSHYVQQLATYLYLYAIENGVVAVKGKGMDDWKFFHVKLSEHKAIVANILRRGVSLRATIQNRVIPHRICQTMKDKRAIKCPMREKCFMRDARYP